MYINYWNGVCACGDGNISAVDEDRRRLCFAHHSFNSNSDMNLPTPRLYRNKLPPLVPKGKDYHCYLWCSGKEADYHTSDSYLEKLENRGYKCACFRRDVPANCPDVSGLNNIIMKCHWFLIPLSCVKMRRDEVYELNVILKYVASIGKACVLVLLLDIGMKDRMPPALLPFTTIDTSRDTWVDQVGQLIRQTRVEKVHREYTDPLTAIPAWEDSQLKYITYSGDTGINGIIPKAKINDLKLLLKRDQIEDDKSVKKINEQLEGLDYESTTTPNPEGLVTPNQKQEEKTEMACSQSHPTTDASTQQIYKRQWTYKDTQKASRQLEFS